VVPERREVRGLEARMSRVDELARDVARAATADGLRFPQFKREAPKPRVDPYAPPTHVEQYRLLAAACEQGDCQYAVVPGAEKRPSQPGRCDGWRGTVHHERVGPVLRVSRCERAVAFQRHERETRGPVTKGGKNAPRSWTGESGQ
jgi:hypothetical protein